MLGDLNFPWPRRLQEMPSADPKSPPTSPGQIHTTGDLGGQAATPGFPDRKALCDFIETSDLLPRAPGCRMSPTTKRGASKWRTPRQRQLHPCSLCHYKDPSDTITEVLERANQDRWDLHSLSLHRRYVFRHNTLCAKTQISVTELST